jgi:hypothetical protein
MVFIDLSIYFVFLERNLCVHVSKGISRHYRKQYTYVHVLNVSRRRKSFHGANRCYKLI